ncbi:MAG TPA: hypothetical protein VH092_11065, partial [Urbifossiella sp.]|nr:hypothetical protein [Urbifossiella sp.]
IQDPELRKKLEPIQKRADAATGRTVNHVGVLYAKLFWLFQPDDKPTPPWPQVAAPTMPAGRHIPDKALTGLADPRQVTADKFNREPVTPSNPAADDVYVIEIRSRADALFALSQIAAQGESYQLGADSHFNAFLAAYDKYGAGLPAGAVRPAPTNPSTGARASSAAATEAARITHPKAVRWARLFNLRYQLLLLELWLAVNTAPPGAGPLAPDGLLTAALREMRVRVRKIAAETLPALPLKDGGDAATAPAAAPFELPVEALPATDANVKQRLAELLDGSEALAQELEHLQDPNALTAAEKAVIAAMRTDDKKLRPSLPGG